jgi:hypothetical protein
MSCWILKNSIFALYALAPTCRRLPDLPDRDFLKLFAAAIDQRDQSARDENRAEHRRHDPQAMDDGEAAHRTAAENKQRQAGNQRRHVRIENRVPGPLVAGLDRRVRRVSPSQLFAYALVDQDVGVDRHAEGQRHRGDARQGQRRLEHRQDRDQQQQVHRQRDRRYDPHQHVVRADEHREDDEAVQHRIEALFDVVLAERRTDGALLDDLHRSRQRPRAHQQRDVVGFARVHPAADLNAPAADFLADHRRGDDFGFALFDQQDRHPLADVLARDLLEDARAGAIEIHVNRRLVVSSIEARLRVADAIAGQHYLALDQDRRTAGLGELVVAQRNLARQRHLLRGRVVVDHANFQRRGAADNVLGTGRVLHARQLHDDPVGALLLDDRLGDAELIDPVAQDRDVLLDRAFLDALLRLGLQAGDQLEVAAAVDVVELQVGKRGGNLVVGLVALPAVAEAHGDILTLARDARIKHLLLA